MFAKKSPEVLVVGAGPVGLLAALVLAKRGIAVQIVDKEWRTGAHSYALALHGRSLRLLRDLGLLDRVLARAYRVDRIGLCDRSTQRAEMRLAGRDDDCSFVAVMPQDAFEGLLEESLKALGVPVRWNHEVSRLIPGQDGVHVTINQLTKEPGGYAVARTEWVVAKTEELFVPLVIGADGHQSLVRRASGIDFAEAGETDYFNVFEFETDVDFKHQLRIVLDDLGTDAVWPLPGGRCRWSFQVTDLPGPEPGRKKDRISVQLGGSAFATLSEANLRTLLREHSPWFQGRVGPIHWRIAVRFERRLANEFGRQRVWLAGDAGHLTGPVGMQSMNVGLREAFSLAEIFAGVLRGRESLEQLANYGRDRVVEWRQLLGFERGLKAGAWTDAWVRQHADRLLSCIPATGPELSELAQQVGLQA